MSRTPLCRIVVAIVLIWTQTLAAQFEDALTLRHWMFDVRTGEYVITATIDGEVQRLAFLPSTYIEPTIAATLSTSSGESVEYAYAIRNGSGARQYIRACSFAVAFPAEITSTPFSWTPMITESRGRIAWVNLAGNTTGIEPSGRYEGFVLRARALPGLGQVECRGNGGQAAVEAWVSRDARRELDGLLLRNFVAVTAVVPSIALSADDNVMSVMTRVRTHYARILPEFDVRSHRQMSDAMIRAEDRIRKGEYRSAGSELERVLGTLPKYGPEMELQIVAALHVCLQHIIATLKQQSER